MQEIFDRLVKLPPGERRGELDRLHGDDSLLRTEIEGLLEAADQAGGFMESSYTAEIEPWSGVDVVPARCGVYELQRQIGQGGSGSVYLAVRDDDVYRRQVAVKIIPRSRADPELLHRFRNERQILASLDHPHIAELFDGGSTENGLPYFVMEHVDGLPIDEYCDRQRLSIEERLELFGRVCAAVAHAHQKLVVHRDLKPSNILVTGDGVPKLLDFGIAKLLDPGILSWDLEATATWCRPLTPHYASPEQLRGQLVTTRSDVYSLGVLLCQLLTGRLPSYTGGTSDPADRLVAGAEPRPPSAVIREPAAEADAGPLAGLRPKRLRKRLTGDLDTIVLTALRQEPERRYGSVERLSEDIRRHLTGRPVLARSDTWSYRLGKLVRRQRIAVGMAALFVLVVIALIVSLSVQSVWLAEERDEARRERDRSTVVLNLLQEVLATADPYESGDHEPTAGEILERSTARVPELANQPAAQADLMSTLGFIYLERGEWARAQRLLAGAVHLRRQVLREENAATTETMGSLGIALRKLGRYDEAERLQRETLAMRRQVFGDDSIEMAYSFNDLGILLARQGRHAEAEELYRQALARYRQVSGEASPEVATALNNLAVVQGQQRKLAEAERTHREVLEMRRELLGREHLYTGISEINLAHTLLLADDWRRAEPHLNRGERVVREVLAEGHPEILRVSVVRARLVTARGDAPGAERILREVLPRLRKVHGDHPYVAGVLFQLAELGRLRGGYEEAEPLARQALVLRQELLGEDHPETVASRQLLAQIVDLRRAL